MAWNILLVSVIGLYLSVSVKPTMGTCDTNSCPIVCRGYPCGTGMPIGIDPLTTGVPDCLEAIIESPGYPTSYPDDQCEWVFSTDTVRASIGVTFLDLDGVTRNNLQIIRTRIQNNGVTVTDDIFDDDLTEANIPTNPTLRTRANMLQVIFTPVENRYHSRGLNLRIMWAPEDAGTACSSSRTIKLVSGFPTAALNSPDYPFRYPANSLCFYTVTSPADTRIVAEFIGLLSMVHYEDFIYIYDTSDASNPSLLRIVSNSFYRDFSSVETDSNNVQFVFEDRPGTERAGFFVRVRYEEKTPVCSGNGNSEDTCSCTSVFEQPVCAVDEQGGFYYEELTANSPEDLSHRCSSFTRVELDYTSDDANAILASDSYFTETGTDITCVWRISGPEGARFAIIFQDFELDNSDTFMIRYIDGRVASGIARYSSDQLDLPLIRDSTTFPLINNPIIIDSNQFRVNYAASAITSANKGPLFEVHILDVGNCSSPCLNGGRCSSICTCNPGFVGEFCEHTLPPDYACVVKNHYVTPNFAYPVQLFAIAGINSFNPGAFSFEKCDTDKSLSFTPHLPSNAAVQPQSYGSTLSLPSKCDPKDQSTRFGVFSCDFAGDEFVEQVKIPAIVNPISELLSPVGRFTKTVSVNEEEVTLSVTHSTSEKPLRWRFNGLVKQKWEGKSSITIKDVQTEDSGIYECFIRGNAGIDYDVVTYRIIVRACPTNLFNPPACDGNCPTCQNGGSCTDDGYCLCPPAYGGSDCSELLTGNTISRNTALTCPGLGISSGGCKGVQICLPDPGGCMCMPGWTGNKCDQPCPPLKYGLECLSDCSCGGNMQCDVATGACPSLMDHVSN